VDKDTRNAIERATQRARKLLEEDFAAQLEGDFDVHRDGAVFAKAGVHLSARQAFQRERIVASIEHKRAAGMGAADSVAYYMRDAAFTTLNRFVALKMLEARELVQECITKGEQSAGYLEYSGMAPGLLLLPNNAGYRLYIESLFDELSTEVKVLFDRRDPSSVLWPKRATFEQLLGIINATELVGVWGEDETIGWVYQYFNSQDERKKMREESPTPRNSHELAVRNQFFTPRYVVEFLTDNTLGRIWYEMRGTMTVLADRCKYMVRKPSEEFAPRANKDPRDLRVLDPACGSGHFLLYAFDLLLAIYEEAHTDPESPKSEVTGRTLAEDYPSLDALRRAVPGLVLAHNLHGVDIDPRCSQIAQLALWMRAQKAYRDAGVSRAERPQIDRSNILVAEPLVMDEQIAAEFVATLGDAELGRAFMALVEALNLAGDLGVLLRIESLVAPERKQGQTGDLFAPPEERIRAVLARFIAEGRTLTSTRHRLFADDAMQGIGLLSISGKLFDVVLMNPPFGEPSQRSKRYLYAEYPHARGEILANFVERAVSMLHPSGMLGAITSRTCFFLGSLTEFRREKLFRNAHLELLADLGDGVLDATVETAAYCISRASKPNAPLIVFRALLDSDKAETLSRCARAPESASEGQVFRCWPEQFLNLTSAPLAYWIPPATLERLAKLPHLDPAAASVLVGLQTGDDYRFLRNWWEISPDGIGAGLLSEEDSKDATALKSAYEGAFRGLRRWAYFSKTDFAEPWLSPIHLVVKWSSEGCEIRSLVDKNGAPRSRLRMLPVGNHADAYFLRGYSYMLRSTRLVPYIVPPGVIPTAGRSQVYPIDNDDIEVLALLASNVGSGVARLSGEKFAWPKFQKSMVQSIPFAEFSGDLRQKLRQHFDSAIGARARLHSSDETSLFFVGPNIAESTTNGGEELNLRSLLNSDLEGDIAAALGLEYDDLRAIESDIWDALSVRKVVGEREEDDLDEDEARSQPAKFSVLHDCVSYFIGASFGRWDIRLQAKRDRGATRPDPFAPLPCAPPAALSGPDHLPVVRPGVISSEAHLTDYPVKIFGDGISHDDEGDGRDLIGRIKTYIATIANDSEAAALTDADLRLWTRTRFFEEHIRRYTRGRRKAPIYWQLATPSSRYSVWLYIHAFNKDTLFRVQSDYAAPKLAHEERRLESLTNELRDKATAAQRKEIADREVFVDELRAFLTEVGLVAPLWNPDLDDGVIINFAPLWRLVPQNKSWKKELKSTWDALCEGKLDWSHLAMHLWPERVVPKCAEDRSLAIAQGLEDVFWIEGADGKWTTRKAPTRSVEEVVHERASPAVKSALKSLIEAPPATGNAGRGRGGRRKNTAEGGNV